ncbi:F-box protein [Pyrus ussuriensis x Pyrus communis]|uniref:F-box protein n=1 Tax=Pyrus ussuriensis x Pyrus communis TaxID=2448454 RepID=A0A5N5FKH0_9ROSA|nr:F-box protein [Pyrus ussuriensis x Pyrus communis]
MSSEQPLGPTKFHNFSLSFLPCFEGPPVVVSTSTHEFEPGPTVLASYNDLLLCCATMFSQRDYYICNPYTKQWDALPPPPQCHDLVKVGLICNPGNQLGVLNNEYSYRVVRIIIPPPPVYPSNQFKRLVNGMLYFGGSRGLIGLKLYSSNINATSTIHCRFLDLPEDKANVMDLPEDDQVKFIDLPEDVYRFSAFVHLGSIKAGTGRGFSMRMCESFGHFKNGHSYHDGVGVWDYFEDDQILVDKGSKRWCLVGIVPPNWVRRQCPSITDCSCKYKVHVDNCTRAWRTDLFSYGDVIPGGTVLPYVIPRWPTLVLGDRQRDEGSSSYHVAEKVSVSATAIATSNPFSYPSVSTGSRPSSSSTRSGLEEIQIQKQVKRGKRMRQVDEGQSAATDLNLNLPTDS